MMSLIFALVAAVNGPTGPRAILFYGLGRTKRRRRQSGQRPTPGILTPQRRPRPVRPHSLFWQSCLPLRAGLRQRRTRYGVTSLMLAILPLFRTVK